MSLLRNSEDGRIIIYFVALKKPLFAETLSKKC